MAGKHMLATVVVVVMVMSMVGVTSGHNHESDEDRPQIGECTHNDQCGPLSCCTMGSQRYSITTCKLKIPLGERCREAGQKPNLIDRVFTYPNGATVLVEEGFSDICPCQSGLICLKGICQKDPAEEDSYYNQ